MFIFDNSILFKLRNLCMKIIFVNMSKKISPEDAFYENLTLGLIKTLTSVPRVCNVSLERRQPLNPGQVVNWEQRHCVYLPEDMKKFYLSTDGFVLNWSYQYAPSDIRRVGYIHFPHLLQVTLLRENIENTHPTNGSHAVPMGSSNSATDGAQSTAANATKDKWGNATPIITAKSKIFEINNVNEMAKVCMLYESTSSNNPKFYLLELSTLKWQFLAETFSEYLRMSIAHLGLPYWELCFSSFGLPSWTEQLFLLLAPHLLEEHDLRRGRIISPASEHPYNIIDPNVFRGKPKGVNKTAAGSSVKHNK
ncbi:tubulin polyglutamylase complex subunit 2 [Scaptodrosophila lebanonensis]|uniref:Tubulin polyglutamylase complex subunit 2 n=1 Tax=Drosophila lebanonensis TaxID=7225 RepID=A0A6J2TCC4_DROLE|nr:tubulin polyglutamylase complex subunit 2 [Scaptodrosophila lebanonensis]